MFFSASIAFTLLLSFTGAVQGAPLTTRRGPPPVKACTGINGTGDCTILNVSVNDGNGLCTNVSNPKSLVMNIDNVCASFPNPNCDFTGGFVREFFPSTSGEFPNDGEIRSFSCSQTDGLVDGLFPQ
ncbi:hypothetical protein C8J57DRAFT_1491301 [Mycena rebaudengoi]|nr:hypothetical protein C8J57DRAFT_1491301 [Mycena rebaudengoi]